MSGIRCGNTPGPFIGPEDPVFAVPEHGKTVLNNLIGGHANCTRFDQIKNAARDLKHHHDRELGWQVNGALDFSAGRSGQPFYTFLTAESGTSRPLPVPDRECEEPADDCGNQEACQEPGTVTTAGNNDPGDERSSGVPDIHYR